MNDGIKISTILSNGTKVEYNVILTYQSQTTKKNYCIYTDNTLDKKNKLRFYAAIYDPTKENPYLGEPTTKEEWNEITRVLNNVLKKA